MAKKATKAIPNSTISIVPATGEFKKRLPNTSQKVNIARENKIEPDAIAAWSNILFILICIRII